MATKTSPIKTALPANTAQGNLGKLLAWLPIKAGLCAASLIDLLTGIRSTNEQKHGPIVLSIAC